MMRSRPARPFAAMLCCLWLAKAAMLRKEVENITLGHSGSMLVLPKEKLALCTIAKVGFQNFNDMFNQINDRKGHRMSSYKKVGLDWKEVTKDNGWKFAVFFRDPLERYLSAWGSKCLREASGHLEGNGARCDGEVVQESNDTESMIQAFERRVQTDVQKKLSTSTSNGHFMTQVDSIARCDSERFDMHAVNFLGSFSDGKASEVVHDMLVNVKVPHADKVAEKWFPRHHIAGHSSDTHGKMAAYFRNRATVLGAYELYKEDYETLGLAKPEILQEALDNCPHC